MLRSSALFFLLVASRVFGQTVVPSIIPAPVSLVMGEGVCSLQCLSLAAGAGATEVEQLLRAEWNGAMPVPSDCNETRAIKMYLVRPDTLVNEEAYWLNVTTNDIELTAVAPAGLFRGSRTLTQLIEQGKAQGSIPCLSITDFPRFPWRGMHLDVCRHFFTVDFVKRYIDLLAGYKMNSFHWHLTDDQGWRIAIKKYPKLTTVGAWRSGSQVGPYGRREYDSTRYGGFYTQEQIRDVVDYAAQRHVNVVPEIEMPGHALAALAAYPQYSCTGGPFEVEKGWGVFPDVFCPGNDSTFTFLEDILDEVIELFPSPYIHIGGDECPHERWEKCPRCQALMKKEGLKSTDELQSYFIRRIEKHVNAKGRKIIGWDEILQGGLAPNATVMSWTGIDGGIAAAKSGHDAVMSPGSHCYFDHYQGDPANEPLAIGGYTPVQKVYGYEPIPDALTPEQAKHILGAQGNLWAEYILTPEHMEYMALPRMAALAEVLWSPKEKRNEADFLGRLKMEFKRLDALGVNYSKSLYQVAIRPKQGPKPGTITVELESGMPGTIMRHCTCLPAPPPEGASNSIGAASYVSATDRCDQEAVARGAECTMTPKPYDHAFTIDTSAQVTAELQAPDGPSPKPTVRTFRFNKATGRKITTDPAPNERYDDGGPFTLVDGISAGVRRVNTEWLGWRNNVTVTVDLGVEEAISRIGVGTWHEVYAWIHAPKQIVISTSTDGTTWTPYATVTAPADAKGRTEFDATVKATARYVRLQVKHAGNIPEGLPGAGSPSWLFLDEIEVE